LEEGGLSKEALLFGESQTRAVISVDSKNIKAAREVIESYGVPHRVIGRVGGEALAIKDWIHVSIPVLVTTWRKALQRRMAVG
jgi:phosphoribosylformylglycinamidine synthase